MEFTWEDFCKMMYEQLSKSKEEEKENESLQNPWIDMDDKMPQDGHVVELKCSYWWDYTCYGYMENGNRGGSNIDPDVFNRSAVIAWREIKR